jgi:hypothetical protein
MKRKLKIVMVILLAVAILVPSALVFASETQMFIFSKDLRVEKFSANDDSYSTNVFDSEVRVADIYVRLEHPLPSSLHIPMLVSIWHAEDTELDSLTLKFSSERPAGISLFMEAPEGLWPETQFHQDENDMGVVFAVKDLGFYGTGTVTLNFILVSYWQNTNLGFRVDFSMHKKTFLQLTSLKADAYLYTSLPS